MQRLAELTTSLVFVACGSSEALSPDLAMHVGDAAVRDLSENHCLPSTPPTDLVEGPCAIAPQNGYCLIDIPDPRF